MAAFDLCDTLKFALPDEVWFDVRKKKNKNETFVDRRAVLGRGKCVG
jgi:hypothetical protein